MQMTSNDIFDNCKESQQSIRSISQNKTTNNLLKNDADCQNKPKLNVMEIELTRGGRMKQVEMLNNFGLERSLTATYNDNRSILELLPRTVSPKAISKISNQNEHNDCEKIERNKNLNLCKQTNFILEAFYCTTYYNINISYQRNSKTS
ncbi:unnamed protein product [Onchocerca flexuosa]|uniref:Uncharacterized protein n=1 Tax=Onchocerca flexuosa TaxID=387005 RepID=A0A183H3N1_9BILA|nr:unnamed protein product [Onchocerca flexuosa]